MRVSQERFILKVVLPQIHITTTTRMNNKKYESLTLEPMTEAWDEISSISFPSRIWHQHQSSQPLIVIMQHRSVHHSHAGHSLKCVQISFLSSI